MKNPQPNAIIERLVHQKILGHILRVVLHINPLNDENDANQIVDNALVVTCLGALVFQRDIIINIPPLIANLLLYSIHQQQRR